MRWAVAFGCGVGLFTLAMVFQGAVPPAAIAAIGVGAFGLGFLRPPPLHSLLAFLIGLSVTLVAALWFSRAAASCVLFPLAFTALHGFLFAPTRDPGRPKSLLAEAQLRQVFFRAAAVVFAISLPACMLVRPRWYHAAALASSFMVASVAWLSAVRALGRLLSLAARVTPAQHGEPREPGRELDVGIGDEGYAVDAKAAGPYRGVASSALRMRGDLHALVARSFRQVGWGGAFVALGLAAILQPSLRVTRRDPPVSRRLAPKASVQPRDLGWFPQDRPILADINHDGMDDIIGLRWDWADEDAALVVVANDGRTFRRIWETRPFRAQWASASNQLALSERRLFMTDSEGTVRVIDLDTGNVLARSAGTRMNEICVANDGSGQVWVSGEVDPFPRGWLFGEDAKLTPRDRPGWCVKGPPACSGDEPTLCVPSARPAELAVGRARASVSRMAGIAVAVVTTDDDGGGSVIAYDPHTLAVRWRRPLALSAEPMHAAPSFSHQQDGDVLFIKYQLESGRWLLGARDLVTGDVLWSKSPLAAAGSHVPSMFAKSRRLYVRVNSRLEIIEGEKGTLLGVAR